MKKQVAIVGIGQTSCKNSRKDISHMELLYEATQKALENARLSREEIGSAFTTSYDLLEGRSLSNQYTLDSIGGVMKSCDLRLGEDGLYGLIAGYMEVLANPTEIVVVGSVQKGSERIKSAFQELIMASLDPLYTRPVLAQLPANFGHEYLLAAFEARRYMYLYDVTEKQMAMVTVKNRRNAINNPLAQVQSEVTIHEVMGSRVLCYPLKELDVAPISDGACTIILASHQRAKEITDKPVWVAGIGWATGSALVGKEELGKAGHTYQAAKQAYKMAGVRNPLNEINVAEIYDPYTYKELQHYEALGFCQEGDGGRFLVNGISARDGKLPVNPSGGLLGHGNPIGTAGLMRVAQAALQVRGDAGACQVPNVHVTLAQACGGVGTHCGGVVILCQ